MSEERIFWRPTEDVAPRIEHEHEHAFASVGPVSASSPCLRCDITYGEWCDAQPTPADPPWPRFRLWGRNQ